MYEKMFEVSDSPRITVEDCVGNLSVKMGGANQVTVKMPEDEDTLVFDQDGDVITLTAKDNCRITCPANSTLNFISIRGNLKVKDIDGGVKIDTVNGNTDLRGVGAVTLNTAQGNLRVKTSAGPVEANNVGGSTRLQKITGSTKLGNLGGSLRAAGLMQGLVAEAVGADARLEPPYTPGETYQLTVGSDLVISLPDEPNLSFEFTAGGQVKTNVTDLVLSRDGASVTGTLGEGEAIIAAIVGGSVVVGSSSESDSEVGEDVNFNLDFDFNFDPESLAFLEDLGPQIEATVTQAMAHLDTHLAEGLKYFDSDKFKRKMEKVAEKAQRVAEKVERQAEGIAEQARKQAERAVEKARMHEERTENRMKHASVQHSTPQQAPVEDKLDEQLSILRQIEDGKITAEEAVNLLEAAN